MPPTRLPIFISIVLALATANLHAFTREIYNAVAVEWNKNRTLLIHLSLPTTCTGSPCGPFTDGFQTFNDSAEDALNLWNQHLVHMQIAVNKGSILAPSDADANTSVTMSNTIYGESFGNGGVLAVTLVSPRTQHLIEADVIFNAAFQWDSYRGALDIANKGYDFHRVALHEFGHVLGLDHPDEASPVQHVIAIMNSHITNFDSLQQDDINGIHSIYDSGPPYQSANPAPNLVNLSTRAFVGTGNNVVIGGFIVQGSQPATVILRGIGYSLPAIGINNALEDPVIELRDSGGGLIATSDDWIDDSWASTVASYHLDPSNSRESAIYTTLNPGSYTVVLRAFETGDTGVGLIELYDLHTTNGRAGNISTRGPVQSGNQVLIGGFIAGGSQTKTVVVRAIGPSLSSAGISGALSDPTVELRNSSGALVAFNDNWQSDPNAAQIQSAGLAPTNQAESALQLTLSPGSYTAIVRGANNTTGVGLVEIYDLSPAP